MGCSVSDELMGPIVALLNSREALYPQMCLLKGKLELVRGHVAAKQYKADVPNEALLTYQDGKSVFDTKICLHSWWQRDMGFAKFFSLAFLFVGESI